jgi:hypothetical protein
MHKPLLAEIDRFIGETGMSEYQFGISAVSNGRLVERLRAGRRVWPETEAKILSFIRVRREAQRISQ